MNRVKILAWAPAIAFAALCMYFAAGATPQTTTGGQTKAIVTATTAFLTTLSTAEREKVHFPFTPQKTATAARFARSNAGPGPGGVVGPHGAPGGPGGPGGRQGPGGGPGMGPPGGFVGEQYGQAVRSNFPVSDVPRPGLPLGSLSTAQPCICCGCCSAPRAIRRFSKSWSPIRPCEDSGTPFSSALTPTRWASSGNRASHRHKPFSTTGSTIWSGQRP